MAASSVSLSTAYKAAVIGAGPAGLALIATLLDTGVSPILWVDPTFTSGRLANYTEVPSNTKVRLFTQYATTSPSLNAVCAKALEPFKALNPDEGCPLGFAQRMVTDLTAAVRAEYKDKVHCHTGLISSMERLADGKWQLDNLAICDVVHLATGAHPRPWKTDPALPVPTGPQPRTIDLDDLLMPSRILSMVKPDDVIGVVGSSHSAILVLRNLLNLPEGSIKKVVNLYRSPLLYAEYKEGYILYDNTGLKGIAADWAHDKLDTKAYEHSGHLERICVKGDPSIAADTISRCTAMVYAVGFDSNTPPEVRIVAGGEPLTRFKHDFTTGSIEGAAGVRGFGIAFPERITDPHGNVEMSVGLWKFMRYIREALARPATPEVVAV